MELLLEILQEKYGYVSFTYDVDPEYEGDDEKSHMGWTATVAIDNDDPDARWLYGVWDESPSDALKDLVHGLTRQELW